MLHNVSSTVKHKVRRASSKSWDAVIAKAERQLKRAEGRVDGLKRTIQNFIRLRDSGMPWPGEKSATQN